jgi:hypothetical protein
MSVLEWREIVGTVIQQAFLVTVVMRATMGLQAARQICRCTLRRCNKNDELEFENPTPSTLDLDRSLTRLRKV